MKTLGRLDREGWSMEARVDYALLERRELLDDVRTVGTGAGWKKGELVIVRSTWKRDRSFFGPHELQAATHFDIVGEHGETSAWGIPACAFSDPIDLG